MKLISSEMDAETEKWQEINSNAQFEVRSKIFSFNFIQNIFIHDAPEMLIDLNSRSFKLINVNC